MVSRRLRLILLVLLNTNACRSTSVSVVETHTIIHDNFIFLGSKLIAYNCSGDMSQRTIVIHENVKLGERDCKIGKTNLTIAYRTCTIDEYVALQSCQKTSNSIICLRIKSLVEKEDPCQSITSVMKAEYCLQGLNINLYYGLKSFDSLCRFLVGSSNSLKFSANPGFSLLIADSIPASSVDRTIAFFKVRMTNANSTCEDLRDLLTKKILDRSYARRLIMGETILIDDRTLICVSCSEFYTIESEMTYTSKINDMPKMRPQSDQCPGAKKFLTIDISEAMKAAEPLSYARLTITFYKEEFPYGIFSLRLITTGVPISLKSDSNECRKSRTSIIVCSITLPQKSNHIADVDSITWWHDGRKIDSKSELIVPSEKSDDKFSLYVMYRGNYTCEVAIQVFLTFPSRIEIVRRKVSHTVRKLSGGKYRNHVLINVVIVCVAAVLLLSCLLVMRYKNYRSRKREKTQSLSISPMKIDKASACKKAAKI